MEILKLGKRQTYIFKIILFVGKHNIVNHASQTKYIDKELSLVHNVPVTIVGLLHNHANKPQ